MSRFILTGILCFLIISCVEKKTENPQAEERAVEREKEYPEELMAVFEAHGGLQNWKRMNNLCFEMEKEDGSREIHSTALDTRKAHIEAESFEISYDGENLWLVEKGKPYEGDPRFYYNLMFYFYAMPFIVSDEGAVYTIRDDRKIGDETYGTIHIGFSRNIGDSPEDEYLIFYDKETNQMEWLAYTVTYFTEEKSKEWHYLNYNSWLVDNGLILPENLVFYESEENNPTEPKRSLRFAKITVSESFLPDSVFEAPEGSILVPE